MLEVMPREGVLGQATRIDPVPADHEALDSLRAEGTVRRRAGAPHCRRYGDKPSFVVAKVLIDAKVLFPFSVMDLMFALTEPVVGMLKTEANACVIFTSSLPAFSQAGG
jgi:hypothetical protein